MAGMVASVPNSIGYLSISDAKKWSLDIVNIENHRGQLISEDKIAEGVAIAEDYFVKNIRYTTYH